MAELLVTVVILNWNGGSDVIGCLEHVTRQTHAPIEIIVVDNGSTDRSVDMICRRYPGTRLVRNSENLGYASGMNQGIRLAGGDYVLLLNQDAWIREDFVSNAVRIMEHACPDVGMAAARIFRLEGSRETDQLVGGGLVSRRRVQLVGDLDVTHEHYTMSPSFCCPFLRRAMLDDVMSCCGHYFDDRYFAHGEDLDLALRAQLRGWKCLFSPDLVAWHSHSASLGGKVRLWEKPPFYRKLSLRNRYMTIIKDVPLALIMCLAPAIVIAEFATWPYFLIKSPSTLRCLLEAYVETIRMLPGTYMLRRRIQASRRVSTKYLRQFFRGF